VRAPLRWKSFWITGASSGIGAALAGHLAGPGTFLILSGRSRERLEMVATKCRDGGSDVRVVPFDMDDAAERTAAIAEVLGFDRIPEVLVNNAGVSQRGRADETDPSVDRRIMEVDYLAGVELTKALLPSMVQRGDGCIIAVSSVAGLAPIPLRSSYNAAKSAQIAFFGTLRNELSRSGVQVNVVIPGFVRTEVSVNALSGDGTPTGVMDPNQDGGIDPVEAARDIVRGVAADRRRIYTGFTRRLWVMAALSRLVPGILDQVLQKAEVR
jgi:dehydrogenase/reductase SDR family protein 7B